MPYVFGNNYAPVSQYAAQPYDRTPYGENAPQYMQDFGDFRSGAGDLGYGLENAAFNAAQDLENSAFGIIQNDVNRFFGPDMTIGQALFGGGNSRSGGRSFVYDPQDTLLRNSFYPYVSSLAGTYGSNPYQLIAGQSPYQTAGQQLGYNAAIGATGGAQQAQNALESALDPSTAFNSPYFQSSLQATLNPFVRNFAQNILPGVRSQAVGVGQTGSSRENLAQQDAIQSFLSQIGDISSQFGQNAFNQGIQSRNTALGLAPSVLQSQFLPSQFLQDTGTQQRNIQQEQLQAPITFGQQLSNIIGPPTTLQEQFSRSSDTGGIFGAGGGTSILSSVGSFFSDRRLKKNIKKVGENKGLNVYEFTYLWGQKAIGYMSDEVRKLYPHAVTQRNGFDMVNYGAI